MKQSPILRVSFKKTISQVLKIDIPETDTFELHRDETRAKCAFCVAGKTGKTRNRCGKCMRRICDDHRAGICVECVRGDD